MGKQGKTNRGRVVSGVEKDYEMRESIIATARVIRRNYNVGDFMIIDTRGARYVGFYVSVIERPVKKIVLAGKIQSYHQSMTEQSFDNMFCVDISEILHIQASSCKIMLNKPKPSGL